MELEDTYGISVSEEEAAEIETVGQAVDFVAGPLGRRRVTSRSGGARHPQARPRPAARRARPGSERTLAELIAGLPEELRRQAVTHSSWAEHRADSYGRLAFLGDSVLGLAVGEHLFRRFPRADIGRLTKVHGQAVSGRACAEVAARARPAGDAQREPRQTTQEGGIDADALLASERALASVCEAVIGACYLHHGFEATAEATVAAFADQIELASETHARLQVGASGAACAGGRPRNLRRDPRGGAAARPAFRGRGARGRRGDRHAARAGARRPPSRRLRPRRWSA